MSWARTEAVVRRGVEAGWHRGFQLGVVFRGEPMGLCHGHSTDGAAMDGDTCCSWLSAGKPLTALLVGRAVQRGVLGWDQRIAGWIPDFGAGGKEEVTIRQVLTHTAGMRGADALLDAAEARDWAGAVARACEAPLEEGWVPGRTAGYHARGSWLVLAEVACRAMGGEFGCLVGKEVCGPLGVAGLRFDWTERGAASAGRGWAGMEWTVEGARVGGASGGEEGGRGAGWLDPGSGLRGSAREMAWMYSGLLGRTEGWIRGELLDAMTGPQRVGTFDLTFGAVVDFGLGFVLNTPARGGKPMPYGYGRHAGPRTFGHSGRQSACAFADPDAGVAVAWSFNGMPGERVHQARQREVNEAVYEELGLG